METWDAITSRRDVRSYTDQPIGRRLQDLAKVWRHVNGGRVRRGCEG